MENASKALIIAGAILLSIIIISLGILVVNNGKNAVNKANLDSEEAQAFNSKLTPYVGKNKSANEVNELISIVTSVNGAEVKKAANVQHLINMQIGSSKYFWSASSAWVAGSATGAQTHTPVVDEGHTYEVKTGMTGDGYIGHIAITQTN